MNGLKSRDFTGADEPFALFASWFEEAKKSEPSDPDAMALATAGADGLPDVRMVLLKDATPSGFVRTSSFQNRMTRKLRD